MYHTYIMSNIKDKKEVRARLGKKTVGENVRESLWNFCRKVLAK
jgi:hypothetical protein